MVKYEENISSEMCQFLPKCNNVYSNTGLVLELNGGFYHQPPATSSSQSLVSCSRVSFSSYLYSCISLNFLGMQQPIHKNVVTRQKQEVDYILKRSKDHKQVMNEYDIGSSIF